MPRIHRIEYLPLALFDTFVQLPHIGFLGYVSDLQVDQLNLHALSSWQALVSTLKLFKNFILAFN